MMEPLLGGSVAAAPAASAPHQQPLVPLGAKVPQPQLDRTLSPAVSRPPLAQPMATAGEKLPPPAAPATTGNKGLTALERETALQMMGILAKYKEADPFRKPVDWQALNILDYPDIIKQPMDMGTVREKLRAGAYPTMDAWKRDVALIWSNCRKYNGEAHPVSKMAEKLEAAMERRMDEAVAAATQQLAQRGDSSKGGKGLKPSREVAALKQSAPLSDDDQEDIKPTLHRVSSGARLTSLPSRQPDQARISDSTHAGLKRVASSGLDGLAAAASGNGRPAKRKATGTPGVAVPGVDLDALEQLVNTPAARSLGARRPEQLAFLQLWKNLVSSEEAAAAEAEAAQQNVKKLRRQLTAAEEQNRDLRASLESEVAARRAAEAAAHQLKADNAKLQLDYKRQNDVLEKQKELLEQQQQVIRQALMQKSQQQQPAQQQPRQAPAPAAPVTNRPNTSPALLPQQQQPAPAAAVPQQQRPQPVQQQIQMQAPVGLPGQQPQQQQQRMSPRLPGEPADDFMQP